MSVKNTANSDLVSIMPIYLPGDTPDFSVTVTANADTGNAMTAYRTQQQNRNNWLFGNPAATDINSFIQSNNAFQNSFNQAQGSGRTLQTGLAEIAQWFNQTTNNPNLLWWIGGGVLGVVVLKKVLGGNRRRR